MCRNNKTIWVTSVVLGWYICKCNRSLISGVIVRPGTTLRYQFRARRRQVKQNLAAWKLELFRGRARGRQREREWQLLATPHRWIRVRYDMHRCAAQDAASQSARQPDRESARSSRCPRAWPERVPSEWTAELVNRNGEKEARSNKEGEGSIKLISRRAGGGGEQEKQLDAAKTRHRNTLTS